MKYFHKKTNMICFDSKELQTIFEAPSRQRLAEEILKSGYSGEELIKDRAKMQEITDKVKLANNKEEIEIFSALYIFPRFYASESKICFRLNDGVDPNSVDTLEKLRTSLRENDLTDFLLGHDDGFRAYQLKAYRGKTEINELFEFVKKKLPHYANDLGKTNLLITMQSEGDFCGDFFQDLHERLKTLELKGTGNVIISYNEENKFDVMNIVYPDLATKRIPHEKFEK